jgi:hypothetical protein
MLLSHMEPPEAVSHQFKIRRRYPDSIYAGWGWNETHFYMLDHKWPLKPLCGREESLQASGVPRDAGLTTEQGGVTVPRAVESD